MLIRSKPCGLRKSKKNPDAYDKSELVNEVKIYYPELSIPQIKKLRMEKLCDMLKQKVQDLDVNQYVENYIKEDIKEETKEDIKEETKEDIKEETKKKFKSNKDRMIHVMQELLHIPESTLLSKTTKELENIIMTSKLDKKDEPKSPPKSIPMCISQSKMPLKSYQIMVVNHLRKNRSIFAIHSTGTGKTLTAVTASQCFLADNPRGFVYVLTPTSLQINFLKELKTYGVVDNSRYKLFTIDKFYRSYERKPLKKMNVMLIIDEAHNLRTLKGRRSNVICNFAQYVDKVLLLSATPVINYLSDVTNYMNMMKGYTKYFDNGCIKLINHYKVLRDTYYNNSFSFYNPENTPEFKVLFPKFKINKIVLPMTKKYYDEYIRAEKMLLNELTLGTAKLLNLDFEDESDLNSFYNGVRRVSNSIDQNYSPKNDWILNHIKNSKPHQKYVIFSHFIKCGVTLLTGRLKELNIKFATIKGDLTQEKRALMVKKYNNNQIKILFITKAGGEGLDLKGTSNIIILEPSWNESTIKQVIGRGIRLNSHSHLPPEERFVNVYKLFLIKPQEYDFFKKNPKFIEFYEMIKENMKEMKWSIDLYMYSFLTYKQNMINNFMREIIIPKSIEYNK